MTRVHRHPRLLSTLAFGLLALVAELVGRSVTHRVDLGRHVAPPSYSGEEYYPILLGVAGLLEVDALLVAGGAQAILVRVDEWFAVSTASGAGERRQRPAHEAIAVGDRRG